MLKLIISILGGLLLGGGCSSLDKKLSVKGEASFEISKTETFKLLKGMANKGAKRQVATKNLG